MTKEKIGKCHDCPAPQTEVNMLSRHILELQKDKGELTDRVRELEKEGSRRCIIISGYARKIKELTDELTKAKALLKQFLEARNGEDTYKAEFEAEQFLKE